MSCHRRFIVFTLFILVILIFACTRESASHEAEHPVELIPVEGSDIVRVKLTEKAIERIDLKTAEVTSEMVSRYETPRTVVPYSSIIYTPDGKTWIYKTSGERTFERIQISVDYIEGDRVVLKDSPSVGTVIASVGVAELYGSEFEVGH